MSTEIATSPHRKLIDAANAITPVLRVENRGIRPRGRSTMDGVPRVILGRVARLAAKYGVANLSTAQTVSTLDIEPLRPASEHDTDILRLGFKTKAPMAASSRLLYTSVHYRMFAEGATLTLGVAESTSTRALSVLDTTGRIERVDAVEARRIFAIMDDHASATEAAIAASLEHAEAPEIDELTAFLQSPDAPKNISVLPRQRP